MKIKYNNLKTICEEKGLNVLESTYLGDGILGRFFPPNIILINKKLCDSTKYEKQKKILVLLHEMCHWFKWKEHKNNSNLTDEEACFEFEVICNEILNENVSINKEFEAVQRLGLQKPMSFLKNIIKRFT